MTKALTIEQLKKNRYGKCFVRPQGWPYRPESCAQEVSDGKAPNYKRLGQCQAEPGYGPDKLYCKKHAEQLEEQT